MNYLNRPLLFSLTILLLIISGESILMSFANSTSIPSQSLPRSQGISGTVLRLSGDHQPTVDKIISRRKTEPIKTNVWIFAGRIPASGTHWPVAQAQGHPQLIKQIGSDDQGTFFVELPPGEYTLLAEYDDNLYLNSFLGDGAYGTVQVKAGEVVSIQLINTEKAYF